MLENEVEAETSVSVRSSESFAMHASCPERPTVKDCVIAKVSENEDESEKSTDIIRKDSGERNEVRDEV